MTTKKNLMTVSQSIKMLLDEEFKDKDVSDEEYGKAYNNLRVKIYNGIRNSQLDYFKTPQILVEKEQVRNFIEKKMIKKTILSPFEGIDLDFDEALNPIESFQNQNTIDKPLKYNTMVQYAVSNKGRIFNLTSQRELKPYVKYDSDYAKAVLSVNGKPTTEKVHKLVATMWCSNRKLKTEVHHIDGDHKNNNAINLVWVTKAEHNKAHRLLKEAKRENNFEEYNGYIDQIKKDNQWEKEYRCLAFEKEKNIIFVWITKESYVEFKKGLKSLDEISTDEVKAERIVEK